ncbi:cellulose binding domain-containing protein, partial [Streptosporangium pseudovulgare]|uniref:cellulose binding domain-containing protein n=1 Tax=Streptosporangium pseudovulgare TaxID=35765 RepID=UPI001E4FB286
STSFTTTAPPAGGCTAAYKVTGSWGGGFQADVTVRNEGASAVSGWTVSWKFANGQTVTQLWNGSHTQSGADVTVRNISWNGNLAPGATAAFGFTGTQNGTNAVPAVTCAAN